MTEVSSLQYLADKLVSAAVLPDKLSEVNFFAMPSIPGVGNADGISFQLNALNQNITPKELDIALEKMLLFINQNPLFSFGFSSFNTIK